MALKKTISRYVRHRKALLRDEMKLVYERDQISRKLRRVRKCLAGWDKWLATET